MAAIEMPPYIRSKKFDIVHSQQLSPSGEFGFVQTLRRTAPFWGAEFDTGPLEDLRWQEWQTFFDQLEGSMYTFLAYDPRRVMPYAYKHLSIASDPWTQSGQAAPRVTAFDYANSTISLDRMAPNAIITKGDYISVKVGNIWYLFRAQQTVVLAGNTVTLTVRPRPNFMSFTASNIRYRRACIEMKMIGRPDETDSVDSFPSFSFRGSQFTARVPL
jgi:hypothetical protein